MFNPKAGIKQNHIVSIRFKYFPEQIFPSVAILCLGFNGFTNSNQINWAARPKPFIMLEAFQGDQWKMAIPCPKDGASRFSSMAEMIFLEDHFRCQATRLAGLNEPEESKVGFSCQNGIDYIDLPKV
jgi:hypothetical protein